VEPEHDVLARVRGHVEGDLGPGLRVGVALEDACQGLPRRGADLRLLPVEHATTARANVVCRTRPVPETQRRLAGRRDNGRLSQVAISERFRSRLDRAEQGWGVAGCE